MISDLTSGTIDAGILWGPMAGFYAKRASTPLHVTPLVKETTGRGWSIASAWVCGLRTRTGSVSSTG
jgi:hypothetical protein